jgi:hypothetical protein
MQGPGKFIQRQIVSASPVTVGDITVTPQSQAVTFRWPWGGLVWNRPVAVLVERGGETRRIPVVDVTRVVQLGLLGFGLGLAVVTFVVSMRRRRDRNE